MTASVPAVTAVAMAAVASALSLRPPSMPPARPAPPRGCRPPRWAVGAASGLIAVAVVWVDGRRIFLALIVGGAVTACVALLRRAREAKVAEARQVRVVELCEALAGELRSGQPLVRSLDRCAEQWADFAPVAAAGRLGSDVPDALRRLAERPGAEGLRDVASAWRVSEQSGTTLASALRQVAASARSRQATRQLVRAELASAQATARLVVLLPLAALAMGRGIGGDPVGFLLQSTAGLCCLAAGVALAATGLFWIDHIAARVLDG